MLPIAMHKAETLFDRLHRALERQRTSSFLIDQLDQAATVALPSTTTSQGTTRTLTPGDIIEIQGPAGSGKTELLFFLAATTLLPEDITISIQNKGLEQPTRSHIIKKMVRLGGRGKSVIVCDCDGRWYATRLTNVISNLLHQRFGEAFPETSFNSQQLSPIIDRLVQDALCRLHIFAPHSSVSLVATLINLPRYHYTKMQDDELFMLIIDGGLSSFYWQDRWTTECGGMSTPSGIPQNLHVKAVTHSLSSFVDSHKPVVILASWGTSLLPNRPKLFKQHLPPPYPSPFDSFADGPSIQRSSPLQITHHLTLCSPNLGELLVSDHLEMESVEPDDAKECLDGYSQIECIMRTPPKDLSDTVVSYISFKLNRIGGVVSPIQGD